VVDDPDSKDFDLSAKEKGAGIDLDQDGLDGKGPMSLADAPGIGGSAPSIATIALQWSKLDHPSWQRSAREVEIALSGGPNLHYVAAGSSSRLQLRVGRMLGWEVSVYSLEHAWAELERRGLGALANSSLSSDGRLVLELDRVGGVGLEMHIVQQSPT